MHKFIFRFWNISLGSILLLSSCTPAKNENPSPRERILINNNWSFYRYDSPEKADKLMYDVRPEVEGHNEYLVADAKPTEAVETEAAVEVLKPWILPTANNFINDPARHHVRPEGNPGEDFPFVQPGFDESGWQRVDLPHDWAIRGPFYEGWDAEVGGGMGRLPVQGVAWYRKKLDIPLSDKGKSIFLDVDGAMSYAMVWFNGNLVGGWPYGYNSWRLDLTPYILPGQENQLAIRLDNPNHSSRWYPGAGIYRNVWLTKTHPIHIGQWGTYITARDISNSSATIDLEVTIDNDSETGTNIDINTDIYALDEQGQISGKPAGRFPAAQISIGAKEKGKKALVSVELKNPKLWGPKPTQVPHLYKAITTLSQNGKVTDQYETQFGIRGLEMDYVSLTL
jgi:beta-galactosidase